MGNDGGSIPRRCELVKEKKKEEKPDPVESERAKWRVCTMSNEPLKEPIVVDDLGHLYNKESILNHLKVLKGIADPTSNTTSTSSEPSSSSTATPSSLTSSFAHITSLKDIVQINCTRNPSLSKDKKSETSSVVVCPITQLETGHYKFIVIRSCGCVMSERAIKEIPSDTCLVCAKVYNKETDVIPLNPSPSELSVLKKRMEDRKQQEKSSRKKRKSSETEKSEKSEKSEKTKNVEQGSSSSSKNVDESIEKKKKKTIDNLLPETSSSSSTKKSVSLPMTSTKA
eukprot:TRINITY_DN1227_c0_g1_i1.p1 TRINITY_DN1227_c0_g1~~TRINITY_DN1227_c0_g1_i1.p1  ORF type:complete len:284 (-),score=77.99 TRINITY_DN1227_c0_g1_i1:84-935(-)